MPDNSPLKDYKTWIYVAGLFLAYIGLFFSPFLTSLGTAVLLLSILLSMDKLVKLPIGYLILFCVPLLFTLSDVLRSGLTEVVLGKLMLSAGFAIFGVSVALYKDKLSRVYPTLLLVAGVILLLVNLISVGNYLINKDHLDVLLLQSKSIPIFGGMHHIHFGIINALAILFGAHTLIFRGKRQSRILIWIYVCVLLVCFHILSSRTGIVSFYSAVFVSLFIFSVVNNKWSVFLIGMIAILALNAVFLTFSTSFANKLANSKEDFESWNQPDKVNYKSMGMRLEAYKVSLQVIMENPLIGVGADQLDQEIQNSYERSNSPLFMENRIGPHNQLLEYAAKYGAIGFFFVLAFFLYWLVIGVKTKHYGVFTLALMLLISLQFESLFERQVSVFLVAALLPLADSIFSEEN